ncbi:hypothetical protein BC833DRAFT_581092 [Globomyces pollinis-pini]|nr:hypothetical protein BC833DRAFT_581092 [Globomyces pollinis-pini]
MQQDSQNSYQECSLISAGSGPLVLPHHVMKIPSQKFKLDSFKPPFYLNREKQKKNEVEDEEQKAKSSYFKKKTKAFFLGRHHEDVVLGGEQLQTGSLIASIGSRHSDPDKSPWILKDAEEQTYIGNLEGSQSSNHVLFVSTPEGFKVIPVSKWYKFVPKLNHRTLTLDEAEAKMSTMGRVTMKESDLFFMKDGDVKPEQSQSKPKKEELKKPKKSWKENLYKIDEPDEKPKPRRSAKKEEDTEDLAFDFEEEFEDDEVVDFGMDDEEEAKEAKKRLHSKSMADERDKEHDIWNVDGAKLAKSLVKRERQDIYDDAGDDNPYWSDVEEDEEETKPELQPNLLLEKAKKLKLQKQKSPVKSVLSVKQKLTPEPESASKKQKLDDNDIKRHDRSVSPAAPPPPSAAEVISRKIKQERRQNMRASASPAPSSPPPIAAPPVNTNPDIMTSDDLIRIVKNREGITVREVVDELRMVWFNKYPEENKRMMKVLMKQCLSLDKETNKVKLKDGYENWVDPRTK